MSTLPKFTITTSTGEPRAIINGRHAALRVQDHFQQMDMIPHYIRPTNDDDERMDVLRGADA